MRALIINKNNPKVNIVTGSVSNISIGLIETLMIANIAATITATRKSLTFMPGSSQQVKYMIPE
jgi:hypothetical protein